MPVILAAPVIWVGLELLRSYLLTGFMMVVIGQTQYRWIPLIQVADLTGTYGLSFSSCSLRRALLGCCHAKDRGSFVADRSGGNRGCIGVRLRCVSTQRRLHAAGPRVALIQGSIDTTLKADPAKNQEIFNHYYELTLNAIRKTRENQSRLDLIVCRRRCSASRGSRLRKTSGRPKMKILAQAA